MGLGFISLYILSAQYTEGTQKNVCCVWNRLTQVAVHPHQIHILFCLVPTVVIFTFPIFHCDVLTRNEKCMKVKQ